MDDKTTAADTSIVSNVSIDPVLVDEQPSQVHNFDDNNNGQINVFEGNNNGSLKTKSIIADDEDINNNNNHLKDISHYFNPNSIYNRYYPQDESIDNVEDNDNNNHDEYGNTIEISRLSLKRATVDSSSTFLVSLFILHGIGALLPWNMLIDAVTYFELKINQSDHQNSLIETDYLENHFHYHSKDESDVLKENMFSYISIASKAPNILLQSMNIWFTLRSVSKKNSRHAANLSDDSSLLSLITNFKWSLTNRIQLSLIIQIILFIALAIFAHCDTSNWSRNCVFAFIIACTIGLNMANGIYQSCIYGAAARIPHIKFTNAITIGMSLSGTITSLLNIASIAISPSDQTEIIVFFSLAAAILFFCLATEFYYVKYFSAQQQRKNLLNITVRDDDVSSEEDDDDDESLNNEEPIGSSENVRYHSRLSKWQLYVFTLTDIWPHLINIVLTYFLTFSLFPAVVANVHSSKTGTSLFNLPEKYFTPVCAFFTLNFFTSLGNWFAEYFPLGNWPGRIGFLAIIRFIMVPFFLYCNYLPPTSHRYHIPILIHQDWIFVLGVVVLALTAGYLSSLSMMYAPKSLRKRNHTSVRQEQLRTEAAGMISALTVILGILAGANSSLIYPRLI